MTTHIMLDLETLGTRPGAVILSAALVRFSDFASTSFVLSRTEQIALGSFEDQNTLQWWSTQNAEAWRAANENPVSVVPALQHLAAWIAWASAGSDTLIWCHGATFDGPLLGELYRRAGLPCPWHYNAVRCTRTLYDLAAVDLHNPEFRAAGTLHNALDDAMAQTRAAKRSLEVLSRAHQSVPA